MATKQVLGQHTAGIFADMTVDGPEIGTLVLVIDRAKNLPNRKTMGKQNPYCAARLGKEAKKTETDKRGGQTPRWDQELRFTVHDSPDYFSLKISVFSEDKRTDLIGEAWVSLTDIVVPGGGKADIWQGLNCKGRYAGELRMEITYYDNRPKPEKLRESVGGEEETQRSGSDSRVRRRPLPSNPNSGTVTPNTIPEVAVPTRARHGPRDYRTPPRVDSIPFESVMAQPQHPQQSLPGPSAQMNGHPYSIAPAPFEQMPRDDFKEAFDDVQDPRPYENPYAQPDFLPQLPPSERQGRSLPQQYRNAHRQSHFAPPQARSQAHTGLPHTRSAPTVPSSHLETEAFENSYQLHTDYPEPIPDVDYQHRQLQQRRNEVPQGYRGEFDDPLVHETLDAEADDPSPPPPPMHSNSAPVVPQFSSPQGHAHSSPASRFSNTPLSARQQYVPNASPLQSLEHRYTPPQYTPAQGHPARGRSVDDYSPSPEQTWYATPTGSPAGQTPSPRARTSATRALPHRHSIADPYGTTPPRPHPLSHEIPRARSPVYYSELPGSSPGGYDPSPYQTDRNSHIAEAPLVKPRAISPRPTPEAAHSASRPRSSYSIQYPVRAHETSENSPLSTSNPRIAEVVQQDASNRKSLSPRPSPAGSGGAKVPYGPDSFDVHNPSARPSTITNGASPHSPYHIRGGSEAHEGSKGPIVGWHGQEIDPSDHLPVDSWAPEPEKKALGKTYGLGRDRDFGPRNTQAVPTGSARLSNDTVVNFRMRSQSEVESGSSPTALAGRNRLTKKSNAPGRSTVTDHPRDRSPYDPVPNPYAQQEYSRGFHDEGRSPGGGPHTHPHRPAGPPSPYQSHSPGGGGGGGYGAPELPPKLPLPPPNHRQDALAREIGAIDIGSSRSSRASVGPSPTAYVPVRSHRDRNSYY